MGWGSAKPKPPPLPLLRPELPSSPQSHSLCPPTPCHPAGRWLPCSDQMRQPQGQWVPWGCVCPGSSTGAWALLWDLLAPTSPQLPVLTWTGHLLPPSSEQMWAPLVGHPQLAGEGLLHLEPLWYLLELGSCQTLHSRAQHATGHIWAGSTGHSTHSSPALCTISLPGLVCAPCSTHHTGRGHLSESLVPTTPSHLWAQQEGPGLTVPD